MKNTLLLLLAMGTLSTFGQRNVVLSLDSDNGEHPRVATSSPFGGGIPFVLDDGSSDNNIGDGQPFFWFNRFTPDAGDFPFRLNEVQVFWPSAYVTPGDDFSLYIYQDADSDPSNGMDLIASYTLPVGAVDTFDVHTLTNGPVLLGPGGDVCIGIVNRVAGSGPSDFPAALDQTSTAGRSWAGSYSGTVADPPVIPADNGFDTIDSFGFPGNWMIRASGTQVVLAPTLGEWGLVAFVLLLMTSAVFLSRRRRIA